MDEARSEWQRIQRREALFELTMAHGRADLIAKTPITLVGWKPQIDGTDWLITEVEDILNDKGFITRIRCDVKVGREPYPRDQRGQRPRTDERGRVINEQRSIGRGGAMWY